MKVSQIKANPKNPRQIQDAKFDRLKRSIKDFEKMMELRPIVIDDKNVVLGGNMRLRAIRDLGYKDIPDSWVKRAEGLTEEQKREFIIKDNSSFGEYDWDVIANEWTDDPLEDWGLDVPTPEADDDDIFDDEDEALFPDEGFVINDCIYPSNNEYDIPTLRLDRQAGAVELPLMAFGADARTKTGVGTYHFYVDDYRFESIWKSPVKILESGCLAIVEPNISLFDTTPLSYGLYMIYRKRWISRFLQDCDILVYADLNVSAKFYQSNALGIPEGYNAFFTRGYSERPEALNKELEIAQKISGKKQPNLVVYGGGQAIKEFCTKHNLLFVTDFITERDCNGES